MFKELEKNISDWSDDEEIRQYLNKILHKEAFDRTGVIYGMGHAVLFNIGSESTYFQGICQAAVSGRTAPTSSPSTRRLRAVCRTDYRTA